MHTTSGLIRNLARTILAEASPTGPSYSQYVERKRHQGEKPLPKEEWEAIVEGKGKPSKKEPEPKKEKEPDKPEPKSDKGPKVDDKGQKVLDDLGIDEKDLPQVQDLLEKAKAQYEKETGKSFSTGHKIENAIRWLSGKEEADSEEGRQHPAQTMADALHWLLEKGTALIDFDEFVTGLPAKTKQLAESLTRDHEKAEANRKKQEEDDEKDQEKHESERQKAEEQVEKTYAKYVERAKKEGKKPLSKEEWESKVKDAKPSYESAAD
jgi:hypothetical protein